MNQWLTVLSQTHLDYNVSGRFSNQGGKPGSGPNMPVPELLGLSAWAPAGGARALNPGLSEAAGRMRYET